MFGIRKAIRDVANRKYTQKLNVQLASGLPLVNCRCHINAVQAVKNGMAIGVVEAVLIYNNSCTVHFINLLADGSLCDYTLGQMAINDDYRLVRHVHPNEYETINDALMNRKHELHSQTPWYIRLLIKITRQDWC